MPLKPQNSTKPFSAAYKGRHIHESNSKIIYDGNEAGTIVFHFKEDETKQTHGHGANNNLLSEHFMTCLEEAGIQTHFIKRLNMREQLAWAAEPLPFQITLHAMANPKFAARFGIEPLAIFANPVFEFKNLLTTEREFISLSHIENLNILGIDEIERVQEMCKRAMDILYGNLRAIGYKLINVQFELGRQFMGDFPEPSDFLFIDDLSLNRFDLLEISTGMVLSQCTSEDTHRIYQDIVQRFNILHTLHE